MNNNQIGRLRNGIAGRQLVHGVFIVLIVVGIAGIAIAQNNTDNDTLLKFKGGMDVPVPGEVAANGATTLKRRVNIPEAHGGLLILRPK